MVGFSNAIKDIVKGTTKVGTNKVSQGAKNVAGAASDLGESIAKGASEAADTGSNIVTKKVKSGIGKNSLIGGAIGTVSGAGVSGVTAMATGADEDNTKSMIFMGALAGGAGGALIGGGSKMIRNKSASGSFFAQATEAAEQMAKEGGKNAAINGGANGLFEKAKGGFSSIGDKIDDIGYTVQHKYTGKKGKEFSGILKNSDESGAFLDDSVRDEFIKINADAIKKNGSALGGGVQGMAMGATTGAVIGGISGGIDEDDTFIGGALKGSLIGGTLGGVGGAVGGYAGKSGKLINSAKTALA